MAVLRMNAREFAKYHRRLAENLRPTLMRGVRSGAQRAISYLIDQTRKAPPANPGGIGSGGAVNTGAFIRGWRSFALPDGAVIKNIEAHGPIVDGGRRPGKFPPRWALVPWIMRRLKKSKAEAEALYYPIAKAIASRGLIARQILSGDMSQRYIAKLVREEILHEIDRELEKME
jgi:hypothetical protein